MLQPDFRPSSETYFCVGLLKSFIERLSEFPIAACHPLVLIRTGSPGIAHRFVRFPCDFLKYRGQDRSQVTPVKLFKVAGPTIFQFIQAADSNYLHVFDDSMFLIWTSCEMEVAAIVVVLRISQLKDLPLPTRATE